MAANKFPELDTTRSVDCRHEDDDDALLVEAVVGTVKVAIGPPWGQPDTWVTLLACTHWRRSRAVMGAGAELALGYRDKP